MKGGWIMADLALCAREDRMGLAVSAAGGVLVLFWLKLSQQGEDFADFVGERSFSALEALAFLFMGMALLHVMLAGLVLKLRNSPAGGAPSAGELVACSSAARLFRAEAVAGTLELILLPLSCMAWNVLDEAGLPHGVRRWISYDVRDCLEAWFEAASQGFAAFLLLAFFLGIARCLIEAHMMCGARFSGKA